MQPITIQIPDLKTARSMATTLSNAQFNYVESLFGEQLHALITEAIKKHPGE